jgi:hypothetical protein
LEPQRTIGRAGQSIPGYYVWQPAGTPVAIHLDLEVVDRLLNEALTGFGAIPRRGAEVGGILIGASGDGIVRIDDFQPVPCEYKRGPSYLLSESDRRAFEAAYQALTPAPGLARYAVGYYRSNTRDPAVFGDEDRELCSRYFPPPSNVALLIKPYTSKITTAGFLTYQNGRLPDTSPLEFPLRRWELAGEEAPQRRPLGESKSRGFDRAPQQQPQAPSRDTERFFAEPEPQVYAEPEPVPEPAEERPYAVTADPQLRKRRGWMWLPMSFIFLLLGVVLGFQAALTWNPHGTAGAADPYALSLAVTTDGDSLHVGWDRQAAAIRTAENGRLEISDGNNPPKVVDLSSSVLQTGSVTYRRLSDKVRFRMELSMKDHTTLAQTVDWAPGK